MSITHKHPQTSTIWYSNQRSENSHKKHVQNPKTHVQNPKQRILKKAKNSAWQTDKCMVVYASCPRDSETMKNIEKKFEKPRKSAWQMKLDVISFIRSPAKSERQELQKRFKKSEKSSWQKLEAVIDLTSCLRERKAKRAVPCKLNNVKMTFITLDKLRFVWDLKKQPTKILE